MSSFPRDHAGPGVSHERHIPGDRRGARCRRPRGSRDRHLPVGAARLDARGPRTTAYGATLALAHGEGSAGSGTRRQLLEPRSTSRYSTASSEAVVAALVGAVGGAASARPPADACRSCDASGDPRASSRPAHSPPAAAIGTSHGHRAAVAHRALHRQVAADGGCPVAHRRLTQMTSGHRGRVEPTAVVAHHDRQPVCGLVHSARPPRELVAAACFTVLFSASSTEPIDVLLGAGVERKPRGRPTAP